MSRTTDATSFGAGRQSSRLNWFRLKLVTCLLLSEVLELTDLEITHPDIPSFLVWVEDS